LEKGLAKLAKASARSSRVVAPEHPKLNLSPARRKAL
jgi:hypothetical protein